MTKETLTVTDNRTGQTYELPIEHDTINAMDLRQIRVDPGDFGMMAYDPGFKNTASTKSTITFIDGGKGILRYRGYPIEQLAEKSNFIEVAYLTLFGELPTQKQYDDWAYEIRHHTFVHENIKQLMEAFRYDAHPMSMFISTVAALSTYYPEARDIESADARMKQIVRLIAKVPTIAAFSYRHSRGLPYVYPNNDLGYTENLLYMLDKMGQTDYAVNPTLARALDVLFMLHVDHEQNCGTATMRVIGSSHSDPYSSMAGAAAALFGPLHGGANEAVLRMLVEIGDAKHVPEFMEGVKNRERLLMGFGHRVYKNYDPRARIIKKIADEVFEITGRNPLLDIALELERIALEDEFFVKRNLYPNVDFYSGIIYQAMGFPVAMFPVLFAIPRTVGWLAQWQELLADSTQKIARPRQIYLGEGTRDYVAMDARS
ncbi:MAG: citrate synthase [Ardenticatenaceae bacterium]|nr:citrate synthase [Anaerolineales bacterium]MCB8920697.1 citrate synthase [Ardenticatenaceae bacterium]MCB8989657.1 citrate synthase [Ardenticatenaceae bacterium]MCB9002885.1 citrate synthase [Ardenticatenaceae bacterium]